MRGQKVNFWMLRITLTILFCGTFLTSAQAGGVLERKGWWVVLGSFADPDLTSGNYKEIRSLHRAARRCNFSSFDDFSRKFTGFAPDFDVVVAGPYSREESQSALRRIRLCVPDAYVKFGRYLGE